MPKFQYAVPTLGAVDVKRAKKFWVKKLGFKEEFGDSQFAGIRSDDVGLFITRVDDPSAPHNIMAWIIVDDVAELHKQWSAVLSTDYAGTDGPAMTGVGDSPMGREFAVRDTEGNCVHFVTEAVR